MKSQIDAFIFLTNSKPMDLEAEINSYLKKGWQPYGTPVAYGQLVQAMVRYEDGPDPLEPSAPTPAGVTTLDIRGIDFRRGR